MGRNDRLSSVIDWMTRAVTFVIVLSLVAGIAAAAVGGPLSQLGSGYGGLYGLPDLLLTVSALLVIVPAVVIVARRLGPGSRRRRRAVIGATGVWVIAIGYSVVAHVLDPCLNGWWDATSRIGSEPLCERFGSELNWHTRFHLLAHAAPAAVLLGGYQYILRRWGRPDGRPLHG